MVNLKIHAAFQHGYTPVVDRPMAGIERLQFGILRLRAGERFSFDPLPARETGVVILSGRCTIETPDVRWPDLGQRNSVFDGPATAVYLPPRTAYAVVAHTALEVAVVTAPAEQGAEPTLILPEDVIIHRERGRPGFLRDVHDIIVSQVPAEHLLLGETFNRPGEWSSYPPHKHDVHNPPQEVALEEIYFYKLDPPQGFGLQRIYSPERGVDTAYVIQNDDTVLLPWGYHPVVAAPGYRLYYLWFLAGEGRELHPNEDPAHAWVWGSSE